MRLNEHLRPNKSIRSRLLGVFMLSGISLGAQDSFVENNVILEDEKEAKTELYSKIEQEKVDSLVKIIRDDFFELFDDEIPFCFRFIDEEKHFNTYFEPGKNKLIANLKDPEKKLPQNRNELVDFIITSSENQLIEKAIHENRKDSMEYVKDFRKWPIKGPKKINKVADTYFSEANEYQVLLALEKEKESAIYRLPDANQPKTEPPTAPKQ